MREINKISESLFEKVRDRFDDVSLGDENAKATSDPEKARFFNFDYIVDGENYGNITLSLIDETSLKVYFSKNITEKLEGDAKQDWYAFLKELREFSRRNLLSFEPRDITRKTLKHRDVQQQSKTDDTLSADDVMAESKMYGTKNRSYEKFGPVRIKVKHSKQIPEEETRGARSRNIESVFLENSDGERFKLPFKNLVGARAMARHVSAGGLPTDDMGKHISQMVKEMMELRPFVRGMKRRTFEDAFTSEMVESAFGYHGLLKSTLKKIKGPKGYTDFKESFKPSKEEKEVDITELKDLFVKKTLDERIEQALPLVHKAHNIMKETNNPQEAQQFEDWAEQLSEETWEVPTQEIDYKGLADVFKEPIPVGVDAMDAQAALQPYLGDSDLYKDLETLAEEDPEADARAMITNWLGNMMPDVLAGLKAEFEPQDDSYDKQADKDAMDYEADMQLDNEEVEEAKYVSHAKQARADRTDGTMSPISEEDDEEDKIKMDNNGYYEDEPEDEPTTETSTYGKITDPADNSDAELKREAVYDAILRRLQDNLDLVIKIGGPAETLEAIKQYTDDNDWSDLHEIGTSDVSNWVNDIVKDNYMKEDILRLSGLVTEDVAVQEGKMKDLAMDIEELSDEEFEAKYKTKKSYWQEVKDKNLRQDPNKKAYISKMKKHGKNQRPDDWAGAMMADDKQMMSEAQFDEAAGEKDACYNKVKSRYKVWPSAYASGALTKCRKVGAKNWGNSK